MFKPTITVNMKSCKYEEKKFNCKNNFAFQDERSSDSTRSLQGLIRRGKKPQKMNNDECEEMDAKIANAVRLNLSNEVMHTVTNKEKVKTI